MYSTISLLGGEITLTHLFAFIPLFFVLFLKDKCTFKVSAICIESALLLGLIYHLFSFSAYMLMHLFAVIAWQNKKIVNKHYQRLFSLIIFIFSLLLLLHFIPEFYNQKLLSDIQVSENAPLYHQYLNFDKLLLATILLLFVIPYNQPVKGQPLFKLFGGFILLSFVVIGIALSTNLVAIELKWHNYFVLWAIANLMFTCFAEEVFFRGFLQLGCQRFLSKYNLPAYILKSAPIVFISLIFAVAHFPAGISYVSVAFLLSCFYGLSYQKTGNIYVPIAFHFLFNCLHMTLLTYPYLA